jgi:hypothetical protein
MFHGKWMKMAHRNMGHTLVYLLKMVIFSMAMEKITRWYPDL